MNKRKGLLIGVLISFLGSGAAYADLVVVNGDITVHTYRPVYAKEPSTDNFYGQYEQLPTAQINPGTQGAFIFNWTRNPTPPSASDEVNPTVTYYADDGQGHKDPNNYCVFEYSTYDIQQQVDCKATVKELHSDFLNCSAVGSKVGANCKATIVISERAGAKK